MPPVAKAAFDEGVAHLQKREYKEAEASFKHAIQPDAESSACARLSRRHVRRRRPRSQAASVWRTSMSGADDWRRSMYGWATP